MASPFDEIDAAGQAVIEERAGEAVTFIGMSSGDFSSGPDPDRQAQRTKAITALSPRMGKVADGIQGRGSTGSSRTYMNNEILVTSAAFSALSWKPKRGDVVVVDIGTLTERRFTVSAVLPAGFGDVQITLSEGEQSDE